ncbi:hypothetical protein ACROYT_G043652 [Oculina patagonica]
MPSHNLVRYGDNKDGQVERKIYRCYGCNVYCKLDLHVTSGRLGVKLSNLPLVTPYYGQNSALCGSSDGKRSKPQAEMDAPENGIVNPLEKANGAQRHERNTIAHVKPCREQLSDSAWDETILVFQKPVSNITWLYNQTNKDVRNCKTTEKQIRRRLQRRFSADYQNDEKICCNGERR